MNRILQRSLMAYRPLYLHGLMLDGQYRLPKVSPTGDSDAPPRQRALLAALTHTVFHHRSKG